MTIPGPITGVAADLEHTGTLTFTRRNDFTGGVT